MIYQPGFSVMNQLIGKAAEVTQFNERDITGTSRKRDVCHVRFAIADVAHRRGLSLCKIGKHLNRDHTTMISALRSAEKLRDDPDWSALVRELEPS